jgi:hypothetical protein
MDSLKVSLGNNTFAHITDMTLVLTTVYGGLITNQITLSDKAFMELLVCIGISPHPMMPDEEAARRVVILECIRRENNEPGA